MKQPVTEPFEIVKGMCEKYQAAVNASDSAAYSELFAPDAIRMPPGFELERGLEEIAKSEQKDYDNAKWRIQSSPIDALRIDDWWIYGIAHADVATVTHADWVTRHFKVTKTWLLQKQPSGEWLIKRQMWATT